MEIITKPRINYSRYKMKELIWKLRDVEVEYPEGFKREPLRQAEDIHALMLPFLINQPQEKFYVICLSSSNIPLAVDCISTGLLNSSLTHPREVFRSGIFHVSASIILVHNHPSGNLEPSREDIAITKQMVEAGKIIGIQVQDHVIVTEGGFTSLNERGLM